MYRYTSIFDTKRILIFRSVLAMFVSTGSGNTGSSSWPSSTTLEVNAYIYEYKGRLDVRRFQAMPICGDSPTVCYAHHSAPRHMRVGAWIKQ